MVANTTTGTVMMGGIPRFPLLSTAVILALFELSNPNKAVRKPLVKGLAAGERQLINAHYPPEGIHYNLVPARFTIDLEMEWRALFELHLMVRLVDNGSGEDNFVLGHINHDQWQKIRTELPLHADDVSFQERWVGVKYSPIHREGHAFLSNNLYNLLLETGLE